MDAFGHFDGVDSFNAEVSDEERMAALYTMTQNAVPAMSPRDFSESFADFLYKVWRDHPFVISSGYRSVEYEKSRGRSGKSAHTKGCAADIVCTSNAQRFELVSAFLFLGVTRIGISKNFIHIDFDYSKPQNRVWTYDDHNHERKG